MTAANVGTIEYKRLVYDAMLAYDYPAVTVDANGRQKPHGSMYGVERVVGGLLRSPKTADVKLGLVNVLYWGHATNPGRQKFWTQNGCDAFTNAQVIQLQTVAARFPPQISKSLMSRVADIRLPGFGFVFITKLLMFLSPRTCPVLDRHVALLGTKFGFSPLSSVKVRDGVLPVCTENAKAYCAFALWTHEVFRAMNRGTHPLSFRAVDLERALFQAVTSGDDDMVRRLLTPPYVLRNAYRGERSVKICGCPLSTRNLDRWRLALRAR